MPDLTINNFSRGLDVRRLPESSLAGALSKAINCHINAGAEIEKRKALEAISGSLPTVAGATFGLASDGDTLYVFGSTTSSALSGALPTGVSYQKLAHPTGEDMTAINDWSLNDGKLYVSASFADGSTYHFSDAARVTDWYDGKARGGFTVDGGDPTVTSVISSILVNGVEALSATMTLGSLSMSDFAETIANQINTATGTPEYTAVSDGVRVVIISTNAGTTVNGYPVSVTSSGVSIGNLTNMAGGADNAPGSPGETVLTLGGKEYTVAGNRIHFSAYGDQTEYTDDGENGAGFIEPATHSDGASEPIALGSFLSPQGAGGQTMLVLCRQAIQVWHVEENDDNNDLLQILLNHGTRAPNANGDFDGQHVFDHSAGIHSIVAGDNNRAEVRELGAPINKEWRDYAATLTQAQQDAALFAVEPTEDRLWMKLGNRVYVLSHWLESGIAAWTRYDFDFEISDLAVAGERLYARSGNTVYLYGGSDNATYDASTVTVRVANLAAGREAGWKDLQGMDVALSGTWTISLSPLIEDTSQLVTLANLSASTFDQPIAAVEGREAYLGLQATHAKTEAAILSSFVLHYARDDSE